MTDYDFIIKCLIIGDSGIGKTSLLIRFSDDVFNKQYISTIGVDFRIKTIEHNDKIFKFQLWDTAGQERFRTLTTSYYRGANAIIVCYDINDRQTFNNVNKWMTEIKTHSGNMPLLILCGTKLDLNDREILESEAKEFAEQNNMFFIETSTKNNINVQQIFDYICDYISKKQIYRDKISSLSIDINPINTNKSKCC